MFLTETLKNNLRKMAEDAIQVQDACNLMGIAMSLERHALKLDEIAIVNGKDEVWIRRHPVIIMWSDKLCDLSRSRSHPDLIEHPDVTFVPEVRIIGEIQKLMVILHRLNDEYRKANPKSFSMPTDERNQHPEVQKQVVKIANMCGSQVGGLTYSKADDACRAIIEGDYSSIE